MLGGTLRGCEFQVDREAKISKDIECCMFSLSISYSHEHCCNMFSKEHRVRSSVSQKPEDLKPVVEL